VIRFSIIQQGLLEITRKEGMKKNLPTSSILACGDFKVVIDTTHPKEDEKEYIDAMMRLGVSPKEVDAVIFTHLHPDHWGHKDLFTNAVFIFHQDEKYGERWFKEDRRLALNGNVVLELSPEGIQSPQNVRNEPEFRNLGDKLYIRHMPGHTPGTVAIFALIHRKVLSWAGDIFLNENSFDRMEIPHCSWDQDRLFEHMDYIRTHADFIVPGHGAPFRTGRSSQLMKREEPPIRLTRDGAEVIEGTHPHEPDNIVV
jgi:glyoxylase-like metal-dependent hydrolase (beta-lactamase superfamily II)